MSKLRAHLEKEAHTIRLSEAEKSALRSAIFNYTASHPLGMMRSPWQYALLHHLPHMTAFVLLIVVSSGASYAARGALPGDALYGIKTQFNERVETALAVSDIARAHLHTELATMRLEEAQALAVEGRLTREASETITKNFDSHAAQAAILATKVTNSDSDEGATIRAQLHVLNVEGRVLAAVGVSNENSSSSENSRNLSEHVRLALAEENTSPPTLATAMVAPTIMAARMATGAQPVPIITSAATSPNIAIQTERKSYKGSGKLKDRAVQALLQIQNQIKTASSTFDATTTAALRAHVSHTEEHIKEGDDASSSNDAIGHYEQALSQGTELQTIIDAQERFKGANITHLLSAEDDDTDQGERSQKRESKNRGSDKRARD